MCQKTELNRKMKIERPICIYEIMQKMEATFGDAQIIENIK